MQYTLSEMSKIFEIPVSTLRYYEKQGGLPFLRRDENGYFLIDTADLPSMQLLKLLIDAGLPVKDTAALASLTDRSKLIAEPEKISEIYREVAAELQNHINNLLRKQQELLWQLELTNYLHWQFERYALHGTSIVPDEPYPGPLPPDFNDSIVPISYEELTKEFLEKYPDHAKDRQEESSGTHNISEHS